MRCMTELGRGRAPSASASFSENVRRGLDSLRTSQIVIVASPQQATWLASVGLVAIPDTLLATFVVGGTGVRKSNRRSQRADMPANNKWEDCGKNANAETTSV